MQVFAANTVANVEVPINVTLGNEITAIEYDVKDAGGSNLVVRQSAGLPGAGATTIAISVSAEANATTAKKDIRQLVVYLTTAAGTYNVNVFYELKGNVLSLTPMTDSFVTLAEAYLVRSKISEPLPFYDALDDEAKAVALENAYQKLSNVAFKVGTTVIPDISKYTLSQFNALDAKFKEAIKKAQIAEADALAEVNPVADKIRMGIVSETIGESSMFFRQGTVPNNRFGGLSEAAYPYLASFLYTGTSSSQVWKLRRG